MTLPRSPIKKTDKPTTIASLNIKTEELFNELRESHANDIVKLRHDVFNDYAKELSKQLAEAVSSLELRFKEMVSSEVEKKLKPLNEKLDSAVLRIAELEEKLKLKENASENQTRANNVTISGVPLIRNENLREVINSISCKLGFNQPLAHAAHRFPSADPSKSVINLKFYTQSDKSSFINAYFKIQPRLLLKDVTGRPSDQARIYINHDLSKAQYEIHKLAMKLKRDGKISAVKIINGQVAIFNQNTSKPLFINTTQELLG